MVFSFVWLNSLAYFQSLCIRFLFFILFHCIIYHILFSQSYVDKHWLFIPFGYYEPCWNEQWLMLQQLYKYLEFLLSFWGDRYLPPSPKAELLGHCHLVVLHLSSKRNVLHVCMYVVGVHVPWHVYVGQRTTCGNLFCLTIPEIECRSLGLVAGTITHRVILLKIFLRN